MINVIDNRPMSAWGPDGKSVVSFRPGKIYNAGVSISHRSKFPVKFDMRAIYRAEVKKLRAVGFTYREIAEKIGISLTSAFNYCN